MKKLLLAAIMAAACAFPAAAQTKIKIMVGGLDKQVYLPAKLTDQLGFFKEQGLEVELYNSTSGSQAATALLSREVQVVVGFYDHTIDLQSKGKSIVNVVQMANSPGEVELVQAKDAEALKNPANWKGKTLGVTGLGSATDFLTRYLAIKAGLKPSEISIVPAGAGDTMISALQQGRVVAGMTTEPTVARALKMGIAKVGIDLRSAEETRAALGGDYMGACAYVDAGWLSENKDTAQKVVNAMVKTLKWIDAHSPEEIADKMPKDYLAGDRDLYVQGLVDGKKQYSATGLMPDGAPESVLRVLQAVNPSVAAARIDLSKTYTTEFVKRANAGS